MEHPSEDHPTDEGQLALQALDQAVAAFRANPTVEQAASVSAMFDQVILRLLSVTARYGEIDIERIEHLHDSLDRFSSAVDKLEAAEGLEKIAIQNETLDAVAAGQIDRAFAILSRDAA